MFWTATFYKNRQFGHPMEVHVETFNSQEGWEDVRVWEKVHALHLEHDADTVKLEIVK